jgi:hypothetical protein
MFDAAGFRWLNVKVPFLANVSSKLPRPKARPHISSVQLSHLRYYPIPLPASELQLPLFAP